MNLKLQELVTNKRQVLLQIVALISEEKRWYSIQEISNSVGLVERSVQRYVNYLYDTVKECNDQKEDHFNLHMKKNKGIMLIFDQKENVNILERFIYEADETIQVLVALLFESYNSTLEYSQKKELSNHTVINSLTKIKSFLQPIDLTISMRDFCIVGSEAQIRVVSNSIAWYLFHADTWPTIFHQINKSKIDTAVHTMIDSLHLDIPAVTQKKAAYMIVINVLRYRKGHIMEYPECWDQFVPTDRKFEMNRIVESIYKSFHIYETSEIRFAVLNLMTKSFIYDVVHLKKNIINNFMLNDADILNATDIFMKEFDKIYQIPLKDYDDIYFYTLRGHLLAKIYKQADFNFSGHSLKNNIREDFPNYYNRMNEFISQLYIISQDELFLEKEYLVELYFSILSSAQLTSIFEKPVVLHLETDLPGICETHIEDFIYTQVKHHFNIVFSKDNMLQKPDLILTNITSKSQAQSPSLVIDYPVSDRTMIEIKEALRNLKNNGTITSLDSSNNPDIEYIM